MTPTKTKLKTDGLIIKENNVGDSDKLLTVLTKDFGIIRAFSRGCRNISSKKFSASSVFTYAEFSLVKSGDTYKIYEIFQKNSFFEIGADIEKLALGQYFCELALYLVPEESEAEEPLRLMLNSLHFLNKTDKNINLIKAITELRFASICGYMPDLESCSICGKNTDLMAFDLNNGNISCINCSKDTSFSKIIINKTILSAMRHIVYSDFSKIFSFTIPQDDAEKLSEITEKFLINQTEHKYKTLDFYKSL